MMTSAAIFTTRAALPRVSRRCCGRQGTQRRIITSAAVATSTTRDQYSKLCERLKEISTLNGISGLLGWDQQVMMPSGASGVRSEQSTLLAGISYEKESATELGDLLGKLNEAIASGEGELDAVEQAVVRDAARNYKKVTALSKEMAQRSAELNSRGYQTWVKAREEDDFSQFAPVLSEWVELLQEKCSLIDATRPAYDVCLDDFERGMTAERLDAIFGQVKEGLVPLLNAIREDGTPPDASWLKGQYDVKEQAALCASIAEDLGFDMTRGRLDVSVHPFTGGAHPSDVRMTTRFKPEDLTEGLTGAIHETGHALYEQGRNLDYDGLPVNEALSMGVHESQSLLWERMVCLRPSFSNYLLPKLTKSFPQLPKDTTPEQLYAALNVVRTPSMIRVESDECTYPMHIILRYEIERGIMDGSVAVADLPELWASKMQEYLGCTPASNAEGVLQDVHWSVGAIGYFPTYSLGAMYAAQIYDAAGLAVPGLEEQIAAGDFSGLKGFVNEKVHRVGSLYPSGDTLMEQVTGAPLDPSIFLNYLRTKYSKLYSL